MKKASLYNRYVIVNSDLYVYNLLSRALINLGDPKWELQLKEGKLDEIDNETIKLLEDNKIITNKDVNEYLHILRLERKIKYCNKNARLAILPTLNCNFKCWYCYENHVHQNMTSNDCNVLYKFSEKLINSNKLNTFTLDWFGGEPLIMFKNVIVPFSKKIMKLTEKNKISFNNMITTNGALVKNEFIPLMNEIKLNKFQITLDGGKKFHNRTRYSNSVTNSYDLIISNVKLITNEINNADITIRINCTSENIESVCSIIDSFEIEVRNKININFQPIWQEVESLKKFSDKTYEITKAFHDAGFIVPSFSSIPPCPNLCYVENMLHYTIVPGLNVFKCTARDFNTESNNYIGYISNNGDFISNDNILRYYCNSFFENNNCKECEVLPICRGNCIQKHIENNPLECQKNYLMKSVDSIIKNMILSRINSKKDL